MIIMFLLLWIILNGRITPEVLLVGLVIAVPVYAFFCRFMAFSPKKEWQIVRRLGFCIRYVFCLLVEIVKANFQVMGLILSSRVEVEPKLVSFHTDLKSNGSKVALANSITLTPGTITVEVKDDRFLVHCLDKDLAEGMDSSVFVELLEANERKGRKKS